jgi:hypothetical protein
MPTHVIMEEKLEKMRRIRRRAYVEANHRQERVLAQWDELFRSVLP